jgi:hypothetical protein
VLGKEKIHDAGFKIQRTGDQLSVIGEEEFRIQDARYMIQDN